MYLLHHLLALLQLHLQSFILDLTPGYNGLGKDSGKMRQETFKLWDLEQLILEIWQYNLQLSPHSQYI